MTDNELVGAILSRKYVLKRVIGAGGMGVVFESVSPDDGQAVAVKVLATDFRGDAEIRRRFVSEGRTCQRLIHPNIVRVLDVAEAEDGTPYIVMELLDGAPLSTYARSGVRLPIGQAATILQGVLAGLGAAHAQGVVHRDLKPENVFLGRERDGTFSPKILDFGIAKVMDAAGGMSAKTRTGALLGTPAYMSPEQIKNVKDVDARSDLWSAGVLLYEMLTGRVAFPAPTEFARLNAVLTSSPPPLESVDPALTRLSAFVLLALQKDPTQRYQSALEMARALAGAIGADTAATAAPPLSQLPNVASVWVPKVATPASSPATMLTPGSRPLTPPDMPRPGDRTLTSASSQTSPSGDSVRVLTGGAAQGTLPSENLPMLSAHTPAAPVIRGVAPWVVLVLVGCALVVGFVLGAAVMRLP